MQLLGQSHREVECMLINSKTTMMYSLLKVIDFKEGKRTPHNQSAIERMCTIRHPNIVPIRGVFVDFKNLYIISDYIATSHTQLLNLGRALTET
jgi:hypothetical protein